VSNRWPNRDRPRRLNRHLVRDSWSNFLRTGPASLDLGQGGYFSKINGGGRTGPRGCSMSSWSRLYVQAAAVRALRSNGHIQLTLQPPGLRTGKDNSADQAVGSLASLAHRTWRGYGGLNPSPSATRRRVAGWGRRPGGGCSRISRPSSRDSQGRASSAGVSWLTPLRPNRSPNS